MGVPAGRVELQHFADGFDWRHAPILHLNVSGVSPPRNHRGGARLAITADAGGFAPPHCIEILQPDFAGCEGNLFFVRAVGTGVGGGVGH